MAPSRKFSLKKMLDFYDQVISLEHQAEVKREIRDEDDLFLLLCFSEMLGIPNPVSYYTLELYPMIVERFHEWHKRMGMEKSPLEGIRCC
ncbi:MAG TPA: cory-CC-star protein [Bacillales bacterium]